MSFLHPAAMGHSGSTADEYIGGLDLDQRVRLLIDAERRIDEETGNRYSLSHYESLQRLYLARAPGWVNNFLYHSSVVVEPEPAEDDEEAGDIQGAARAAVAEEIEGAEEVEPEQNETSEEGEVPDSGLAYLAPPGPFDWESDNAWATTWVRFRQAGEAAWKLVEVELGKVETTLAQTDVLFILSMSRTPLTPGQISAYLFREKHSVSALLSRMENAGLVKKARSRRDQRVVKIQLQPKGRRLLERAMPLLVISAINLMESQFAPEEINSLDRHLKRIRDRALKELGERPMAVPTTLEVWHRLAEKS